MRPIAPRRMRSAKLTGRTSMKLACNGARFAVLPAPWCSSADRAARVSARLAHPPHRPIVRDAEFRARGRPRWPSRDPDRRCGWRQVFSASFESHAARGALAPDRSVGLHNDHRSSYGRLLAQRAGRGSTVARRPFYQAVKISGKRRARAARTRTTIAAPDTAAAT
jgi:hypothetical protein